MTNEEAIEILEERWRYSKTYKYTDAEIREAFDMAIKALEQEPCEDCVSREDALMTLTGEWSESRDELIPKAIKRIKKLSPVTPARPKSEWIPVKWHEITEKERVIEEYPNEWLVHLDCILPEDDEEILITTKNGYVEKDTAYCDDGCYLDSGYDWVEDVIAWMPLPQPYKAESEDKECGK